MPGWPRKKHPRKKGKGGKKEESQAVKYRKILIASNYTNNYGYFNIENFNFCWEQILFFFPYRNKNGQALRGLRISIIVKIMILFFFLTIVSTTSYADVSIGKDKFVITLSALRRFSSLEPQDELQAFAEPVLPDGFEILTLGDKPCRLKGQLPFLIYSNNDRFDRVFHYAIDSWNNAARSIGIKPVFASVASPSEADVTLNWSNKGLPSYAAAGVWWFTGDDAIIITRIVIEPNTSIPEGNLAEILMQELGHITGLGHSSDNHDIMYEAMHRKRYPSLSSVQLTQRDLQAFAWLYTQNPFFPITGLPHRAGHAGRRHHYRY